MFILIIGIIVFVIGVMISKNESPVKPYGNIVRLVGILVFLAGALYASVKQIEPGNVGVQKLFGKVNNNILEAA